jgi:hypothetical protein
VGVPTTYPQLNTRPGVASRGCPNPTQPSWIDALLKKSTGSKWGQMDKKSRERWILDLLRNYRALPSTTREPQQDPS